MSGENAGTSMAKSWFAAAKAWTRASEHLTRSVLQANRAATAAFGTRAETEADGAALTVPEPTMDTPLEAMAYREPDWKFEGDAETIDELSVGDRVTFTKALTDADVRAFARVSGDTNRLHLDDEFAEGSRFGGRIVHGTLVGSLISAALARLPLMTIYLSQDLAFERPVEIGETLTAVCEVVEELGGNRYRLTTCVYTEDDETVIDGEAVVLIDDLPEDAES